MLVASCHWGVGHDVLQYMTRKTGDIDRWLRGMNKIQRKIEDAIQ